MNYKTQRLANFNQKTTSVMLYIKLGERFEVTAHVIRRPDLIFMTVSVAPGFNTSIYIYLPCAQTAGRNFVSAFKLNESLALIIHAGL